jgi:hypothetical protein
MEVLPAVTRARLIRTGNTYAQKETYTRERGQPHTPKIETFSARRTETAPIVRESAWYTGVFDVQKALRSNRIEDSMSGRGDYLKKNGGVPLDHPRRCQAHNRSKHFGREGQPCRRYAAKGATVCTMHGGAAPQVRRKALLRQYFELDQKAQAQAAINVFLPPELHPLVSGGGRGHRKAARPTPEPTPRPAFDGIAAVPRNHPQTAVPLVADAESVGPLDPPVRPPHRAENEMRGPFSGDDDDRDSAPPTGTQLTTLEEAVSEQARARPRGWRASGRPF